MGGYQERAGRAAGVTVWTRTDGGGPYRVLPDGCMDLIWHDGALLVAGPDTAAHVAVSPPGSSFAGLRFAPGQGPRLLGVPAGELRDRRVPLEALWPAGAARRLAARADRDPVAALEEWAVDRVRQAGPADPLPRAVARSVAAGLDLPALAAAAGLGERQVRRRCEAVFGYGPKRLARILRLQRALELARGGLPLAAVAAEAGYADQPHLAREVRALAGVPLGQLLAGA